MQGNVTQAGDPGPAVDGTWGIVDVTPVAPVTTHRPTATLIGALVVLGAVVGAGLWPAGSAPPQHESATGECPRSSLPTLVVDATRDAAPSVSTTVAATREASFVVVMPAEGEVILGTSVAVAGRIHGTRNDSREVLPSGLHVSVVIGDAVVGQADLEVVDGRFVGSMDVVEQVRGRAAELQISDPRRPDEVLVGQSFLLGPAG